jgi:phosphinothricin acetyltransferase
MNAMGAIVRAATEADVPAIRDIYNYEVLNGWATFDIEPKTLEDRLAWFRETRPPHGIIVAEEEGGTVVAWGCLRPFRVKPAYRFTAENSVYVHQDHRGKGHGRIILARLLEMAREGGFHTIIAGIAEGNPASDRLHQSFGFEPVGTEREVGHKFERWLDVTWWQLML